MAPIISKPDDLDRENRSRLADGLSPRPFLSVKPEHFFSNNFSMEVIDQYEEPDANGQEKPSRNWTSRLKQFNLVILIVLVGIPMLVYCVLSSAA